MTSADTNLAAKDPQLGPNWEMVIGLEVHAELATQSKLFSSAPNRFGDAPNTNVGPVCLGLPGTLPVLNQKALELSIRIGLALDCEVGRCVFARKNYFYPDMPKDYQISQFDKPLNRNGRLRLPSGKVVGIERAHMEEDTGKSTHVGESGRIHDAGYSLVDYNRAGVPLIEIVSRPEIASADEAKEYVEELRTILVAIEASDGKMEEGSLRVDANVSVRPTGSSELRKRCEIKNVNSLRSLVKAINYEAARHVKLYDKGQEPAQETRHWDESEERTLPGRSKEDAEDYRYFPDPDLVPINPSAELIEKVKGELPQLPADIRGSLVDKGAGTEAAKLIVERGLNELVAGAIRAGGDRSRVFNHAEHNLDATASELDPQYFADLTKMETQGEVTATQAKTILAEMVSAGQNAGTPAEIATKHGFEAMAADELELIVDQVISDSPDEWSRYCDGDGAVRGKLQGYFVGQVMAATRGQADGKAVNQLLSFKAGSA